MIFALKLATGGSLIIFTEIVTEDVEVAAHTGCGNIRQNKITIMHRVAGMFRSDFF